MRTHEAGRAAAASWTLWGFAAALLGVANLAVMGYDPVPNQHAVVGFGIPLVALAAAAATQALWRRAPTWTWLAGAVAAAGLFLAASALQGVLGEAALYAWGEGSSAEAPFALAAAFWAAGLAIGLRSVAPWWPGAACAGLLLGLYLWASSWSWGGAGAELYGGAVLNGAVVLLFAATGWATEWSAVRAARRQASTATAPA